MIKTDSVKNYNDKMSLSADSINKLQNLPENDIMWNAHLIETIENLTEFFKNHKLIIPLGITISYYLKSNCPPFYSNYSISCVDNIGRKLSKETILIAFFVEDNIRKNYELLTVNDEIIYKSMAKIFHYCIHHRFECDFYALDFERTYLMNTLTEILDPEKTKLSWEIIKSVFFVTIKLIETMEKSKFNILYFMDNLIVRTQDLDITILTKEQKKSFLRIFKTKRSLYLRIFLVLSEYMIRQKQTLSEYYIIKKCDVKTFDDFKDLLSDLPFELIICLTAYNIETTK